MGKIIESKRGILFSARSGTPQSGNSSDITADKFGKLWVASKKLLPIYYHSPRGIDCNSNNVFSVDTFINYVRKFNFSLGGWRPPHDWGGGGTGDGKFDHPYGLTCDNSNVYIADTRNHRIQKFDLDGNYITKWDVYDR